MQVQKAEIRQAIRDAAFDEFEEKGFQKSSLRNIAARAGISVGNVYRYHANKKALFESLVGKTYNALNYFFNHHGDAVSEHITPENFMIEVQKALPKAMDFYISQRREMFILFNKSNGTPFEDSKIWYTNLTIAHFHEHIAEAAKNRNRVPDYDLVRPLIVSFLNGFLEILFSDWSERKINKIATQYFTYHFIALKEMELII